MFSKVFCLGLVCAAASAFAGELPETPFPNAQHTHQAEAQSWEIVPSVGMNFDTQTYDSTLSYSKHIVVLDTHIAGEYGISKMFSVRLDAGMGTVNQSVSGCSGNCSGTETDSNGIYNPDLQAKFKTPLGPGTFKAVADFNFTLAHHVVNSYSGHANLFTGGNRLTLSAAYELPPAMHHLLGARILYDIIKATRKVDLTDTSNDPTTTVDQKGGNNSAVEAYYEYNYHRLTMGGFLRYDRAAASYFANASTPPNLSLNDGHDTVTVGLYFPTLMAKHITLYPEVDYRHIGRSGSNIVDDNEVQLSCYARWVY